MKKPMRPAEGNEKFPVPPDPLLELRMLRDYMQGKHRSVEELKRENEDTLNAIDRKRPETVQSSILKRKDLVLAMAA